MNLIFYLIFLVYYFCFCFHQNVIIKRVALLFLSYVIGLGVYTFMVI